MSETTRSTQARETGLTGVEEFIGENEIVVSKTDLAGKITYCNEVFIRISGYSARELIGAPHSILRHPEMPRLIFRLLWQRIGAGKEIFAFVINRTKAGNHYWVFAHVTPTFKNGKIVAYHSNRRTVNRTALPTVLTLYDALRAEEARHSSKAEAIAASERLLDRTLRDSGMTYDQFVWSLESRGGAAALQSATGRAGNAEGIRETRLVRP